MTDGGYTLDQARLMHGFRGGPSAAWSFYLGEEGERLEDQFVDSIISGKPRGMTVAAASAFLMEAARYFRGRETGGEDRAFWSNVYNAENCEKIAAMLTPTSTKTD